MGVGMELPDDLGEVHPVGIDDAALVWR